MRLKNYRQIVSKAHEVSSNSKCAISMKGFLFKSVFLKEKCCWYGNWKHHFKVGQVGINYLTARWIICPNFTSWRSFFQDIQVLKETLIFLTLSPSRDLHFCSGPLKKESLLPVLHRAGQHFVVLHFLCSTHLAWEVWAAKPIFINLCSLQMWHSWHGGGALVKGCNTIPPKWRVRQRPDCVNKTRQQTLPLNNVTKKEKLLRKFNLLILILLEEYLHCHNVSWYLSFSVSMSH